MLYVLDGTGVVGCGCNSRPADQKPGGEFWAVWQSSGPGAPKFPIPQRRI